ncbi:MAG: peptidylprolyl isomerase [Bacteroidales bacterium]|nr:peptidylprolyl isomerase [Bacteroidales bacterium]
MAALQTLRNKAAWFITGIIALALLAFILTDLLGSGSSLFIDRETVGVIDGKAVKIQDFEQKIRMAEDFAKMNSNGALSDEAQNQIREQVWNDEIAAITFGELYEKAGIVVTPDELLDMVIGQNISPMLRQLFTTPQTGIYDKAQAENFLRNKNSDANAYFFWANVEKQLKDSRLAEKYMNLVRKGVVLNKAQLDNELAKRANSYSVNLVNVRYSAIPDSTISVSDAEIRERFNKDKELYRVADGRDIEYIAFPIRPTDLDREDAVKQLESLKADFAAPETNAYDFAQMNSETAAVERFLRPAQLSTSLAQFVETAQVGEVYGPYEEGNAYKLSRLAAIAMRPDSVKARHILIRDNKDLADSLLNVAKGGANFAELARQYSQDPGSAINGGDLDWFPDGAMVPEFNEACFNGKKGDITLVQSQFGYHIINIQDRGVETKKYSIATIEKTLQYSQRTQQEVYAQANAFAANIRDAGSFSAVVDSSNVIKRVGRSIRSNAQSVNSIRHARELVKWAYEASIGDVSKVLLLDDEFIIATLTGIQEKGYAQVADVSASIAAQIRRDKKAKTVASATQGKSLEEIAALYNTKVDTATAISYELNSVQGAGLEPALVGKIVASESGKVVSAVKGNNGAYAFAITSMQPQEVAEQQVRAAFEQRSMQLPYLIHQVVTDVDVEDNRILFY